MVTLHVGQMNLESYHFLDFQFRESDCGFLYFFPPQYVIKKLNLITSSKRERRAAEQEAQLLSQLRHPNIVTYRESWEGDDCQLYIAMGFCEGGDLYHRLKQQKGELLPERQVVEWFVQIAMALQVCCEIDVRVTHDLFLI